MKHFSTEQWIDFVSEVVSTESRQNMERHLKEGCKTCNRNLSLWLRVRNVASAEKSYQPPLEVVQRAQSAFAASNLALKRRRAFRLADILFDSFLQPAFEGARSAATGTRHMLYRADPYQIDIQIEMGGDGRTLAITGQVLDSRHPGSSNEGVLVVVSNLRGQVIRATTNQVGEFRSEILDSGNLELVFPGLADKPVIIVLRDPLGHASPATNGPSARKSQTRRKGRKNT
jgi:hypothetical protein